MTATWKTLSRAPSPLEKEMYGSASMRPNSHQLVEFIKFMRETDVGMEDASEVSQTVRSATSGAPKDTTLNTLFKVPIKSTQSLAVEWHACADATGITKHAARRSQPHKRCDWSEYKRSWMVKATVTSQLTALLNMTLMFFISTA